MLLAHNLILHTRSKQVEIDLFLVREKVIAKQFDIVHTLEQMSGKMFSLNLYLPQKLYNLEIS